MSMEYLASLLTVERYLYRIGGPILMIIGTISCIISILFFKQKNLRKNPCSIYFIAVNISDLLFIYSLIMIIVLSIGYDIDLTSFNRFGCRLSIYLTFLVDSLSAYYLILASVDRVLVTSLNARTRQKSTPNFAGICILIGTIFWVLFHLHGIIFSDILPIGPGFYLCISSPGYYTEFVGYYLLLIKGILVPVLMSIFGMLTVKNIQSVRRRRIAPVMSITEQASGSNWSSMNPKDRQLVLMLLMNISIYVAFTLPLSIVAIYQQVRQSYGLTFEETQIILCIRLITLFFSYIPHCIDFYCNLMVSKSFRNEIKRLLHCL